MEKRNEKEEEETTKTTRKNISQGKRGLEYSSEETKFTNIDYFVRIHFQISKCFHSPQKDHISVDLRIKRMFPFVEISVTDIS